MTIAQKQSCYPSKLRNLLYLTLGFIAIANIVFVVFVWFNHIDFPLNLESMEGTVLQHFQRAVEFDSIYPEPTAEYVPLAYNPLYYILAIPFSWIFGVNLFTLRLVAILGMLGSGLMLFKVVQEKTASAWWGLMAAGLFAASYQVMGAYLDTAHSDSWFLLAALLGSYLIDRHRSHTWSLMGIMFLIASFWFKQHGALFTIGGLLFLTWREGLRRSSLYWLTAIMFGPILYVFAGPPLFGPRFHYFTWEVPRQWTVLTFGTFLRYIGFIGRYYLVPATAGGLLTIWIGIRNRDRLNIWYVQFIFAALSGFLGTLDPGSADNVYIPLGTWFILVGSLGLHKLSTRLSARIHQVALFVAFAVLLYNPLTVLVSPRADESFSDLITMLRGLEGNVYAPAQGQLQAGYTFYPATNWVALEDMIRGPGRNTQNHPTTRSLLNSLLSPTTSAYVLLNYRLETDPLLGFLKACYTLHKDFEDRFAPLNVLPGRFSSSSTWPRYLYRYVPDGCSL